MKLGARMIKTGLAIMLALFLTPLFGLDAPVFAGIAATFAVQPSIYRSYQSILEQMQANLIGAFFAIAFFFAFGNEPFIVGLAAVLVISINLKLKLESTIPIALVTLVAIMESPSATFYEFALVRFASIMVGVLSAFLINLVFVPPKYQNKLYYKIEENTDSIIKWIRLITRQASEHTALKDEIERLKENMIKMNNFYLLYKEERSYLKRQEFSKARKVVLFRQMLQTTSKALEILKKLHRHENEFNHLPEELQSHFKTEIDCLIDFHEQILLKFKGKVRSAPMAELTNNVCTVKENLVETFMSYYEKNDLISNQDWAHLFPIITAVLEYSENLEHLNKLIDSFQSYHKDENEMVIPEKDE